MDELALPHDASQLVPHRPPMLLIDRLLESDGSKGVVEAEIGADFLFLDEQGTVETVALIEMIAQSYAAMQGFVDRNQGGDVRQGFLVGVKTFVEHLPARLGDKLQIELKTVAEVEGFAIAEGLVRRDKDILAHAEITIWIQK